MNNASTPVSPESMPSSASLSTTTEELFRIWQDNCAETRTSSSKISKRVTAMQQEACDFFASLAQGTAVQIGETTLQTKASHMDALALLIRSLEPSFSCSTLGPRWAALACLVGGIEGCESVDMPLVKLLSTFLLGHIGPIAVEDDDDGGDCEEQIRDVGITGLLLLLQSSHAATKYLEDDRIVIEWTSLRLSVAKSGVERRCAAADTAMDEDNDDVYGYSRRPKVAAGLSQLPRSRRSLCFDLLRAAVDATESTPFLQRDNLVLPLDTATSCEWKDFCKFLATCLHGESDPRCLLQLLRLFGATLPAFRSLSDFPVSEFFDAAAPYYPIQFSPPPNDTYGITRSALREALMKIMSYTAYDTGLPMEDTMASLSCGLILESLIPPPEDDPATSKEQVEALEDLRVFLFVKHNKDSNCDRLPIQDLQQISDALLLVHESASVAVAQGQDTAISKTLADLCRTIVAEVAVCTERLSNKKAWQCFVEEPARKLSLRLDSSSSGRVAIAYIACLASCGGAKTLNTCLRLGLDTLLKTLATSASDEEDTATAAYGIGAFFSSCRTAMSKSSLEGIVIHPHPLQPYVSKAIAKLFQALHSSKDDGMEAVSLSLRVAATRAFESILLATPVNLFPTELSDQMVEFLRTMAASLSCAESVGNEPTEILVAHSQTLGAFLGRVFDRLDSPLDDTNNDTMLESKAISEYLQQDIFSILLSSCTTARTTDSMRYDWSTFAQTSSYSIKAASSVVTTLTKTIHGAISVSDTKLTLATAEVLSFLFKNSGQLASRAFLDLQGPDVTSMDVVLSLVPKSTKMNKGEEARFGMSSLYLPKTCEDRARVDFMLEEMYDIVRLLRVGFQSGVSSANFEELVLTVDKVLPPLTDEDTISLSIFLPFLSGAMESSELGEDTKTRDTLRGMTSNLADFAISSESNHFARSHAARCLHASISRFTPRNAQECPVRDILVCKVDPFIHQAVATTSTDSFTDGLRLLALLGSAAACRGGPSSRTSNEIASFLVNLACNKNASLFLFKNQDIELSAFDDGEQTKRSAVLAISSASAFGSLLSTAPEISLWRQRLSHIAVKQVMAYTKESDGRNSESDLQVGFVATVCHIVCESSLRDVSLRDLEGLASTITLGLSSSTLKLCIEEDPSVVMLILASSLKILCTSPTSFGDSVHSLISGTMRAYASAGAMEQEIEITCKMLALQVLATIAQSGSTSTVFGETKAAVLSILGGAMNHPSGLLRHAAVEVRNTWFLIE